MSALPTVGAVDGLLLERRLGRVAYEQTWQRMREFVDSRLPDTPDELWLLEHDPVYTLGLAGDSRHVLNAGDIPIVKTDRGGQVTYHGPGQLVVYTLLDLRRRGLGPRELVRLLEEAIIATLATYQVAGERRPRAPGVYVGTAKIASLGLRIRRNCAYHGLALNSTLDLAPFSGINPCGYEGLAVTSLAALGVQVSLPALATVLCAQLRRLLASTAPAAASAAEADTLAS